MISQGEHGPATEKAKPSRKVKKGATTISEPGDHKTVSLVPVIVEAGSRSKSSLRHLEEGTGPLVCEVGRIVQAIHAVVPTQNPIVIVYREKPANGPRYALPFGLLFNLLSF